MGTGERRWCLRWTVLHACRGMSACRSMLLPPLYYCGKHVWKVLKTTWRSIEAVASLKRNSDDGSITTNEHQQDADPACNSSDDGSITTNEHQQQDADPACNSSQQQEAESSLKRPFHLSYPFLSQIQKQSATHTTPIPTLVKYDWFRECRVISAARHN
jgi:hypothetical protein